MSAPSEIRRLLSERFTLGIRVLLAVCIGLVMTGLPHSASAQQNLWKGRRTAPRFGRSRNMNTFTYQVYQNKLRQTDRFGSVTENRIQELKIGSGGQYSATVVDNRGQPSTFNLPRNTTLGVQPLNSNQLTVTDALNRRQVIRLERITYDAMGNSKVIYHDSRDTEHELPIEGHLGLQSNLENLYSKSVDVQDELGRVETVRLEQLFRDSTGALKAQVTTAEGTPATIDASRIVGNIPEAFVPQAKEPQPGTKPSEEPNQSTGPESPFSQPSEEPGLQKMLPPPPEQ